MDYVVSSSEDRKLHKKFHDAFVGESIKGIPIGKGVLERARVVKCLKWRGIQKGEERKTKVKEKEAGSGKTFFPVLQKTREGSMKEARPKEEERGTIIEVRRTDNRSLKNLAERVLDVVENELGAVRIEKKDLWSVYPIPGQDGEKIKDNQKKLALDDRYRVYLYIHNGHCIGLLLAERIKEGRKVLPPTRDSPEPPEAGALNPFFRTKEAGTRTAITQQAQTHHLPTPPPSSPMIVLDDEAEGDSNNNHYIPHASEEQVQDTTPASQAPRAPLMASTTPTPAALGISRIWILSSFRKTGIALSLLETARTSFGDDAVVNDDVHVEEENRQVYGKEVIAFSQPTEMGRRFAEKWWGGSDGWLVYD